MSPAKHLVPWGLALLALTTTACSDDEVLNVTVPYQLGAGMTCAEAKVTTIRVSLGQLRDQKFDAACDNSGKVLLEGVQQGKWPLVVEAVDAQGAVTMSSTVTAPAPVVDFGQEAMETPRMILASVPARVQLRWSLGFGDCDSLNLKGFMVQAWDQSKGRMLMSEMIDCKAAIVGENYRELPDPQGRLIGTELMVLTIQPTLNDNTSYGAPLRIDLAAPPGPGYVVRASLTCGSASEGCVTDPNSVAVSQN